MAIKHIRPHQILGLGTDFGKSYKSFIPPPYSGGLMALENVVLMKLLNLIDPSSVFEFGTYRGETTRFIIENLDWKSNPDRDIFTLDIDNIDSIEFEGNDKALATHSMKVGRAYELSEYRNCVHQILTDSMKFDAQLYEGKMDFIFVDANHAYEYVKNDTEKSLKMRSMDKSLILWHDYLNPQFPGLTSYLDSLSESLSPMYHIEETMFVVHFSKDIEPLQKMKEGSIFYS